MIGSLEKRIVAQHRSNEASKRLETIPGIGVIGATMTAAVVPDGADSQAGFRVRAPPLQGRLNGNGREFEDFLVLQVGVGSAVSASLARQIENAVDCPDRVEGAGVAALERHLARPVVVDPVLVA